jgi:hypothetical protein
MLSSVPLTSIAIDPSVQWRLVSGVVPNCPVGTVVVLTMADGKLQVSQPWAGGGAWIDARSATGEVANGGQDLLIRTPQVEAHFAKEVPGPVDPARLQKDDRHGWWSEADWSAFEAREPDRARDLLAGGRYVVYPYCMSFLFFSLRRSSGLVYLAPGQSGQRIPWILISLVLGWWGIPWGPIWTLDSIGRCRAGGLNMTGDVIRTVVRGGALPTP